MLKVALQNVSKIAPYYSNQPHHPIYYSNIFELFLMSHLSKKLVKYILLDILIPNCDTKSA